MLGYIVDQQSTNGSTVITDEDTINDEVNRFTVVLTRM
jgi:hypothetical protein